MNQRPVIGVLWVGLLMASETAAADTTADVNGTGVPWALRFGFEVGADAPAGNYAFGLVLDVGRRLTAALAVGEDLSGQHLRGALGLRVAVAELGPARLQLGAGLSYADGDEKGESFVTGTATQWRFERRWSDLYRANAEAAVVLAPRSRVALRLFGGVGVALTDSTCDYWTNTGVRADDCDAPEIPDRFRNTYSPYAGAALELGIVARHQREPWWTLHRPGRWYGWQLLAVDAVALAGAFLDRGDSVVRFWVADQAGATVVHVLHDHPLRAAASAALRVCATFAGMAAGMALDEDHPGSDEDPFEGAVPGALAGWLAAIAIDALFLASD